MMSQRVRVMLLVVGAVAGEWLVERKGGEVGPGVEVSSHPRPMVSQLAVWEMAIALLLLLLLLLLLWLGVGSKHDSPSLLPCPRGRLVAAVLLLLFLHDVSTATIDSRNLHFLPT